ncbi:MAG TPA: HypC/HybG/HupF family hydrogenase formation chaperone [Candidatus Limnocylindrales bacterium]
MCLDFAARVTSVDGDVATVDSDGRRRRASTLMFPDIAVGDWVFIALGTIIEKLDPTVAASINAELTAAQGERI